MADTGSWDTGVQDNSTDPFDNPYAMPRDPYSDVASVDNPFDEVGRDATPDADYGGAMDDDLYPTVDPSSLNPFKSAYKYGADADLDYLFEDAGEESIFRTAIFQTSVAYVSGSVVGGMWGSVEGVRMSAGEAPRVRLTAVLNGITKRGPALGNGAGSLGVIFGMSEVALSYARPNHDGLNTVAAGFVSGLIFKAAAGPRLMSAWALGGGAIASAYVASQHLRGVKSFAFFEG